MDRTYYRSLDAKTLIEKAKEIGGEVVIALAERLEDSDFSDGELESLRDDVGDLMRERDDARAEIVELETKIKKLNATIMELEEDTAQ